MSELPRYQSDADKIHTIAEAMQDERLSDGAFRILVRSVLFPSRISDADYEWARQKAYELGLLTPDKSAR